MTQLNGYLLSVEDCLVDYLTDQLNLGYTNDYMDIIQYVISPLLIIGGIFSGALGVVTYFGSTFHNKLTIAAVRKYIVTGVIAATAGTGIYLAAEVSRSDEGSDIIRANTSSAVERGVEQPANSELDKMPKVPFGND